MKKCIKVSIIIVNYNRKELLDKCIASVLNSSYENFDIIVVDNGSKDGSAEMVEKKYPKCILIKVSYNSAFCEGNNIGISRALSGSSEGVILLNNDTEVDVNFIKEMVSVANIENKIGMVAAKTMVFNRREINDSNGLLITPDGLAKCKNHETIIDNNKIEEVFCPSGAAAFFLSFLLEDVRQDGQYLDEDFRLYSEDLDLGWRARLRGWKCLYNPRAIAFHHQSATTGQYSESVAYYVSRNTLFNVIKNYPLVDLLKGIFLYQLKYIFFAFGFIFCIRNGPAKKFSKSIGIYKMIKITLISYKDFFIMFPKMLKKRKYIQKRKAVSRQEEKDGLKSLD